MRERERERERERNVTMKLPICKQKMPFLKNGEQEGK
jgi:hypothetical protein